MVEQAVEKGAQAIVFSAIDYENNATAIDAAAAAGVKIVAIDSSVDSSAVSTYIGTDNYAAGRMAALAALERVEGDLKVGIVNYDVSSANGQEREAVSYTHLDVYKRQLYGCFTPLATSRIMLKISVPTSAIVAFPTATSPAEISIMSNQCSFISLRLHTLMTGQMSRPYGVPRPVMKTCRPMPLATWLGPHTMSLAGVAA